jgi:phage-related protein
MTWKIKYYNNDLQEDIFRLPDSLLARYLKLTGLMEVYGSNLGEPHTEAMGDGLFELRLKGKDGIARVFFCTKVGKNIHMLHCFIKKTQKTPLKELRLAKKRMQEVKSND